MKRTLCALTLLLTLFLAGCGAGAAPSSPALPSESAVSQSMESESGTAVYPYTFTDSTGAKVTLTKKPEKIAVLFSSYAQVWTLAGGRVDISVGESVERGFAGGDCVLVDAGAGHSAIDTEALVEAAPDLVIGTADYDAQCKTAEFCRSQGIPAALFRVESFDDYLAMLKVCTDLTGDAAAYETNGLRVKERVDALREEVRDSQRSVDTILFVRAGSGARSTKAKASDDNFACAMLAELGTVNIADKAPVLLDGLSLEDVVVADPDYIFISTMGDETAAREYMDSVLESAGWKDLSAVRAERYVYLPKELFHYKPNNRWDEAYAFLIRLVYADNDSEESR